MYQIEITWVAGIKMSSVKLFSKISNRPGPIIWDSRVSCIFSYILRRFLDKNYHNKAVKGFLTKHHNDAEPQLSA